MEAQPNGPESVYRGGLACAQRTMMVHTPIDSRQPLVRGGSLISKSTRGRNMMAHLLSTIDYADAKGQVAATAACEAKLLRRPPLRVADSRRMRPR